MYKMQNILNIKMRLETQAKTAYAEAAARVSEEEKKLTTLVMKRKSYELRAKELATSRLDIAEIKMCSSAIEYTKEQIKRQVVELNLAQKNLEAARKKLSIAMQERKTHEKLRENAFEVFKQEINDEEKKEIDELVSFNYNDNNKETGED